MAGPVLAAAATAAAPAFVESATDRDGLINKAFKIVMIGALLGVGLLVIYVISLLSGLLDLGEITLIQTGISFLSPGGFLGPFGTLLGAGLTAIGAIAIRR